MTKQMTLLNGLEYDKVPVILQHKAKAYINIDAQIKHLQAEADNLKRALIDEMMTQEVKQVVLDEAKVSFTPATETTRIDGKQLAKDYPEIAKQYKKTSTRKASLRVTASPVAKGIIADPKL